jgi:protein TonB
MSIVTAESPRDLLRWILSATLVLSVHAAVAAAVIQWSDLEQQASPLGFIAIELAPVPVAPLEEENPIVEQVQMEMPVEEVLEKPEEKIEEAPAPEVVVEARPEEPMPTPKEVIAEEYVPPHDITERHAAIPAAPTQGMADASARALARWRDEVRNVIERNKRSINISRRGTTQIAFSLDRTGLVVGTRIIRSSGTPSLDQAAIDIIKRANNFPPPPQELRGEQISISVPISFEHK